MPLLTHESVKNHEHLEDPTQESDVAGVEKCKALDDDDASSEAGSNVSTALTGVDSWSTADMSWNTSDFSADGTHSYNLGGTSPVATSPSNGSKGYARFCMPTRPKNVPEKIEEEPQGYKEEEEAAGKTEEPGAEAAGGRGRGDALLRAPPGLSEVPPLPSRGSALHRDGQCSPCVWNWKPQGCHRGQECGYCHLCPEGEIKTRKKHKLATVRSGNPTDAAEECAAGDVAEEPPAADPVEEAATRDTAAAPQSPEALPSDGSAQHGIGECRPCAWYWKASGCQNGKACRHCHLCPQGEIKIRKKDKLVSMRSDKNPHAVVKEAQQAGAPTSIPPPPGLPPPGLQESARAAAARGGGSAPVQAQKQEVAEVSAPEADRGGLCGDTPAPPAGKQPGEEQQGRKDPMPLVPCVGSAKHGTGECRPCAWFWKPQGCGNGEACRHCHLCPEGEIKARKKVKTQELSQEKQPGGGGTPSGTGQRGAAQPPQQQKEAGAARVVPPGGSPFFPGVVLPPGVGFPPSIGSTTHGTGLCKPCAWFWKPQGCENGRECRHCHLCPEGEIQNRRKFKVAVLWQQQQVQEVPTEEQVDMQSLAQWDMQQLAQWEMQQLAQWELQQSAQWEMQRAIQQAQWEGQLPMGWEGQAAMPWDELPSEQWGTTQLDKADDDPSDSAAPAEEHEDEEEEEEEAEEDEDAVEREGGQSPTTPKVPLDLMTSLSLPSSGPALQSFGKSKPCTWFWIHKVA
mmetsp:Transcript_115139/g.326195  ORF Transcript_115139/g.326195 Transcript_115139/m.326195 type:complete len:738 (-) Transcript_115139:515-2728(-)